MTKSLRDARIYAEERGNLIADDQRPAFHLSTRVGWLNDPNGFSFYNDEYHMFYQYHPFNSHWGPMHWGHAVSKDLLHWEFKPAAMAPDMPYDKNGCFSGSAVVLPDGRHMLMYTGVQQVVAADGTKSDVQTQNLAFGDGTDYVKYEQNPVIDADDLPEGGQVKHFRDPKIVQLEDGSYRAYAANWIEGCGGAILQYESQDALHWSFRNILAKNDFKFGRMWECPDFFELDGKNVLLFSAQDMLPVGLEYNNGNEAIFALGTYDDEGRIFSWETDHAGDYGIDFYAPQTILTEDGRRVMIGWMQNPDTCEQRTNEVDWFGQLSLPRELHVKQNRIYQTPVRELEAYRTDAVKMDSVALVNESRCIEGIQGRTIDLELNVEPTNPDEMFREFRVRFAANENYHTDLVFRPQDSTLTIDRMYSGSRRGTLHQRTAHVDGSEGKIQLRLILDRFSAEVFVNDGEKAMTATLVTDQAADQISFQADGNVTFSASFYHLEL